MPLQKRYKYNYSSVYLTLPKCETKTVRKIYKALIFNYVFFVGILCKYYLCKKSYDHYNKE